MDFSSFASSTSIPEGTVFLHPPNCAFGTNTREDIETGLRSVSSCCTNTPGDKIPHLFRLGLRCVSCDTSNQEDSFSYSLRPSCSLLDCSGNQRGNYWSPCPSFSGTNTLGDMRPWLCVSPQAVRPLLRRRIDQEEEGRENSGGTSPGSTKTVGLVEEKRERERERERGRESERVRVRDRERQRETERQRDRETERQRDRETDRERDGRMNVRKDRRRRNEGRKKENRKDGRKLERGTKERNLNRWINESK